MTDLERLPSNRTEGFALVLTLLFTGIVLLIVVSTAASLATGTRQGGANERRSYQAMLVAESGLNTLPRQAGEYVRSCPYTGSSLPDLQSWLTGSACATNAGGLRAYLISHLPATGNTLTLTALTGSTFTATSNGLATTAKKIIAQDYVINDRTLPPGLRPRSGLISRPNITGSGNASVLPQNLNNTVTTVAGTAVSVPALSPSATVNVASAVGLNIGDYVTINGSTFKISGINGNTLSLIRVPGPSNTALTLSGNVNLVFNAVAANYTGVSSSTSLKISNLTDFALGETVNIGTQQAKISTINYAMNVATFTWVGSPPSTLSEGTPVTRDVTALSSAGTIDVNASKIDNYQGITGGVAANDCTKTGKTVNCVGAGDPVLQGAGLTQTSTSLSFTQLLFGITDQELSDLVPLSQAPFTAMNGGIRRINAADFSTAIKGTTSTGVLIVDGDVDTNMNGTTIFNGLIYIRGNAIGFGNGNFTLNGSLAVRGSTTSRDTNILGSLAINYNAVTLRTVMEDATGSKELNVLPGTWRQQ
ncbi:pilus assembly PilX N-terminal domain-containing protein [Deinococcus sp.]|uniref:pilus assembly PilX N-terminal domain-containing protein n=1 Tax=Deinococcus sp. TaxID=47478 RepID=UPI002869E11C|nr:pilus assembly PilX N-terminal domain-containing protein [Deinococcus sp.]